MDAPAQPARLSLPHALGFALVLALVAWVAIQGLAGAAYAPHSDDGYYLHFMRNVHEHGVGIFPELFDAWNANEVVSQTRLNKPSWANPPPWRIGFIVFTAWWAQLFGASLQSLSWLSTASHLACCAGNWFFARRRMGEAFALALATLWAFSPLLLGLARLALMDSYTVLWVTLSVWLFLEMLESPESWFWQGAFAFAFTVAILTKELSVFIGVPLVAAALIERFARRRPLPLWRFALAFAVPALVAGLTFLLAAGGLGPLLTMAKAVLAAPATRDYSLQNCSGPWYRYLIDYLCLSPFPTLLGLLGAGALVQRSEEGQWCTAEVMFALLGAGLLLEQAPFIKNVRYMVALELPLRFLALRFCFGVARRVWPVQSGLLVAAAVVGMCFLDWKSYHHIFADVGGYDPVSVDLLKAREIIPRP